MSVSVISCIYGDRGYERFIGAWHASIRALNTRPLEVIVVSDRNHAIPCARVFCTPRCPWGHPQAYYLQQAVEIAAGDWVWVMDMDDEAFPDALDGIEDVEADVWQMGYERSDGEVHVPPALTGPEYLARTDNPFTAGSAIRRGALLRVGGFRDVAFQDWELWRRLARSGCTFATSGRADYRYRLHDDSRTAVELHVPGARERHLDEMCRAEAWERQC